MLLKKLFELKIRSVLVEAGGTLNGELVSLGLIDKIYQFVAPKILADKHGINETLREVSAADRISP